MKNVNVLTRFGYFTDAQGAIVAKAVLPLGSHQVKDEFNFVPVANAAALAAVMVAEPVKTIEQALAEKIAVKLEQLAIDELKKEGKISAAEQQIVDAKAVNE